MDTNSNAELTMRVKDLEAKVEWLRQREKALTEQMLAMIKDVEDFRRREAGVRRVF